MAYCDFLQFSCQRFGTILIPNSHFAACDLPRILVISFLCTSSAVGASMSLVALSFKLEASFRFETFIKDGQGCNIYTFI